MPELLTPVVPPERFSAAYRALLRHAGFACARPMLEEAFTAFEDVDGNFIQQFQTDGFDARLFELYLSAALREQGFSLHRPRPNPDFIAEKQGLRFSIEATTTGESMAGALRDHGSRIATLLTTEQVGEYSREELAVRLGSSLFSKLKRAYWKTPTCQGYPFVIAIEAFHDPHSHGFSEYSLRRYLYGQDLFDPRVEGGRLVATPTAVGTHRVGPKVIPSGFFFQPDSQHVSAVLFTNQGTLPKFARLGYQRGFGGELFMLRHGFAADPEPSSMDPALFYYLMQNPPFEERWSNGITLFHNPVAKHPLPREAFDDVSHVWMDGETVHQSCSSAHIYNSTTITLTTGKTKPQLDVPPHDVVTLSSQIAELHVDTRPIPPLKIDRWFFCQSRRTLGALLSDHQGWTSTIFAADGRGKFIPCQVGDSHHDRADARYELQARMSGLDRILAGIAECIRELEQGAR